MALIIEDGSIVANADSYVTVAEFRAYATKRGVTTLPVDDADCEPLLIRAMDYLATLEDRFKGCRVSADQMLSWPRKNVYIFGNLYPYTSIPPQLKAGQCILAMAAMTIELQPTVDPSNANIKRDKTGPLETEFFGPGDGAYSQPIITAAETAMAAIMQGGAFTVTVDRA